ncbi:hypothetical protein GCM10008018_17320 [Paenibacillus marchantiophytorum]|uniref:Peptidase S9 prolyl oligopeptidase catalytic domain-containing protein n=1 Tax=Paenibacillus marchantiophytorum TaxID=1619310 RepID=A0ABQ2BUK1_9BACL|nr:hypothetical protein [Paenibacillus marchantiophytorum]GGI46483.1 hypothetical protein GCM10008018_17320 [Paenibacillus marchantiophytorum]
MELQAYLEKLVSNSHCPITFAGDIPNALSRWLVRSKFMNGVQPMGIEPYLDMEARLLYFNELLVIPREEIEANWRHYIAEMINRYQEVNTPQNLFTIEPDKYMYGLNTVYCQKEQDILVNVITYFPTPTRMWINGQLVITGNHDYLIKDYFFLYRFREGSNTVLFECPLALRMPLSNQEIIVKLNPVDCLEVNGKEFIDEDLLDAYRQSYSLFPERVFYMPNEELHVIVLPQYVGPQTETEIVHVSIFSATGVLLQDKELAASSVAAFPWQDNFNGLLRIRAERVGDAPKIGEVYVYYGEFQSSIDQVIQQVEKRQDCDHSVVKTIKEMVVLPDAFKALNQYVPNVCYLTLFQVLEKFIRYATSSEKEVKQTYRDVFGSSFTVYEPQPNGDRLAAYTVHLPDDYDQDASYPLVVYFHDALARSYPVDLPWVKRSTISEAIIISIVGIGRLNYVDDVNVIRMINRFTETYNVNRNRVYLIGHCTGGSKTLRMAMQVPDTFAGIASVIGDMRLNINEPEYAQLDNMSNMTVLGLTSTEHWFFNSTRIMHFLKRLPKSTTRIIHGFMHNEFNAVLNSKMLLHKLIAEQRDPYPEELKLSVLEPGYNKTYWLKVEAIDDLEEPSQILAKKIAPNRIEIELNNIECFSLLLNREKMILADRIEIAVNGAVQRVALAPYCKLWVSWQPNNYRVEVIPMTEQEFEGKYHAIGVDEERMGIKQIYLNACTIIKPEGSNPSKRSMVSKLAYLLQNPIKDRYIYYKYETGNEQDWDWEQERQTHTNHVFIIDARSKSKKQEKLLNKLDINMDEERLIYREQMFAGTYFTFIKCRHPYYSERLLLIVAFNDDQVETEIITWMNAFETNSLFYNDAVVFHDGRYHGFRDRSIFLARGNDEYESTYMEEYC